MDPEVLTALIAAGVAVVSAVISIFGQVRVARLREELDREKETRERTREAEEVLSRYREPLAHATYDLQAKLYNILRKNLFQVYYVQEASPSRSIRSRIQSMS